MSIPFGHKGIRGMFRNKCFKYSLLINSLQVTCMDFISDIREQNNVCYS